MAMGSVLLMMVFALPAMLIEMLPEMIGNLLSMLF